MVNTSFDNGTLLPLITGGTSGQIAGHLFALSAFSNGVAAFVACNFAAALAARRVAAIACESTTPEYTFLVPHFGAGAACRNTVVGIFSFL